MPTSYTSLLGLALPVQGELAGTWGDVVNNYITQYLDSSIAGTQTISGSQTAVTLSKTTGTTLVQAGSGETGSAQYQIINCTGNPAGLLTITAPAVSKVYFVLNNTSTNQSVKIVGAGPTTGVTVAAAQCALVAWNGSDFEVVASTDVSVLSGILPVSKGGTGANALTGLVKGNGTSAFSAAVAGTDYLDPSAIGTTVQAYDADLTAWAGKTAPVGDAVGTTDTQTLTNKTYTGVKETRVAIPASNIDLASGNWYTKTISGTTTFTVSNVPTTGTAASFILDLTNGGSAAITWWSGVKWAKGVTPTLTSSGRDVLGFYTYDGGTTWTGLVLGLDVK